MLLATATRPDISNTVRTVARYCSASKIGCWKAALSILAYRIGTSDFGMERNMGRYFFGSLCGCIYTRKATDRRSVSGGVIVCGGACQC